MKYIKLYVITILCIGVLSAIYLPIYQTSATPTSEVIALSTDPANSIFTFNNMAPGDKISKSLRVINDGNIDFHYNLSAIREDGDQTLFDKLSIKITEENRDIYEGSLKNLSNFDLGELLSFKKDELIFTIELPKEVGNEVKRKSTSVAFNFVANGLVKPIKDKNNLPKTATSIFSSILVGFILIALGLLILIIINKKTRIML